MSTMAPSQVSTPVQAVSALTGVAVHVLGEDADSGARLPLESYLGESEMI